MQHQVLISKNQRVLDIVGQADMLAGAGKPEQVIAKLREAMQIEPRNDVLMQLMARWCRMNNEFDEPIRLLKRAIQLRPRRWDLYYDLGKVYSEYHKVNEAIAMFRKAHEAGSPIAAPLVELAQLYAHTGAKKQRDDALKLARARFPSDVTPLTLMGTIQSAAGNYPEAEKLYREVLASNPTDPNLAAHTWNHLGQAIDKQGRVAEAWEAYTRGKKIRISQEHKGAMSILGSIEANDRGLTREMVQEWKSQQPLEDSKKITLIAGFPRSGTTMLEVILGTHPEISTLEETFYLYEANTDAINNGSARNALSEGIASTTPEQASAIRQRYLSRCRALLGKRFHSSVIIDKHPMRTHMVPFLLWLVPGSKAIIPIRDPRDVVISNYTQDMQIGDLYTLERIVSYYEACFNFWFKIRDWVGDAAMEVRYEDTVGDLQGQVTRVLEFLGLDWDPAILGFHERAKTTYVGTPSYLTVSKPVNKKAVGRWRRYEMQLRPVLDRLAPFVEAFGYEPS